MTIVELPDKNITLINLNDLFSEQIGSKILKDLKTYKLLGVYEYRTLMNISI